MVFPVVMYGCELGHKESWPLKNWSFQIVMLEKTLESPLDSKEFKPVNPKGSQPWIFIGKTDVEAKAPVLLSHDAKNWLIGKDPDAGKDGGKDEKRATENEMVGWHHQLSRHEFEQILGESNKGKPGMLQFMGSPTVRHDLVTEQQQDDYKTTQ